MQMTMRSRSIPRPMAPDPRKLVARLPLGGPARAVNDFLNRPTGISGRHRPFYFLNLIERARGTRSLEDAVGGRVVVITGASSGIGEAAALAVGGAGAEVVLVARRREELERVADEITELGGYPHVHPADLADPADIERITDEILAQHGRVDVLVNNAGRSIRRSIHLSTERFHDYERTIQLNYLAPVRLILAFLPGMREHAMGHVVNVSTQGVGVRPPRFSGYLASKAALEAFTDCAAAELGDDGVRFTSIHMPLVRTPMIEPTAAYRGMRALSPTLAAERITQAIIHRPRRIGTPLSEAMTVADALSPASTGAMRSAGYRLTRDSRAAGE